MHTERSHGVHLIVESLCAAGYAKRSPERISSHNGYRERLRETRAGSDICRSLRPEFRRTREKRLQRYPVGTHEQLALRFE